MAAADGERAGRRRWRDAAYPTVASIAEQLKGAVEIAAMERKQAMSVVRTVGVGVAITALLTVTTGCGKDEKPAPSSSTSSSTSAASSSSAAPSSASSAAPSGTAPLADYSNLLITAADIGADTTLGPPEQNPGGAAGVAVTFSNTSKTHTIEDLLMVFTDPAAAAEAASNKQSKLGKYVTGGPQPFSVGTNGVIVVGPSPDNTKSVTYVVFSEGKVVVDLEFDSGPNDAAPQDFVLDVAKKQDNAVKTRMTS
ncbi:hypothetical protein MSTO_03860 [Mycobacterium stomatepiae]|uniref:Uncharacterized protein n=2 Tax=Mycobacterium stomatepiae TaxID=470076 RepID=A0A7I7Q222_9MYCO|nr:hypothetical protein MSTO_03860 [Mycobacterium stomatepiae]